VLAGSTITYTIFVTNNSNNFDDLTVSDLVPSGLSNVSWGLSTAFPPIGLQSISNPQGGTGDLNESIELAPTSDST
jgi:uncharacterized repeat protein (TIGR01451 family)